MAINGFMFYMSEDGKFLENETISESKSPSYIKKGDDVFMLLGAAGENLTREAAKDMLVNSIWGPCKKQEG